MARQAVILALLLSGCGFAPGVWCEREVQGETWEAQLDLVLENCAPMVRFSLPSYVAPLAEDP